MVLPSSLCTQVGPSHCLNYCHGSGQLPAHSAWGLSYPPAPALGSVQPWHCPRTLGGSSASCYTKKLIRNLKPPTPGKVDALWLGVRSSSLPPPWDSHTACPAMQDSPWWGLKQVLVQGISVEHGWGGQKSQLLNNLHTPRDLRSPPLSPLPRATSSALEASLAQQPLGSFAHNAAKGTMLWGKPDILPLQPVLHKVREDTLKARLLFISSCTFTVCSMRTTASTWMASNVCTHSHLLNCT